MTKRYLPYLCMLYMGLTWGLSFSLAKYSIELGGRPLSISFWTALISGCILLAYCLVTKRRFVVTWRLLSMIGILSLLGSVLPGLGFYYATAHLPAGILSITIALVPIFTYGMALLFNLEGFSRKRSLGLVLGFSSICVIILPETSLPAKGVKIWFGVACLSSFLYATGNIYLAQRTFHAIHPIRLCCAMHLMAAFILFWPACFSESLLATISTSSELTLTVLGLSSITATSYTLFIFTIRKSGPIFASQVGYLITISGVIWGMLLFYEVHSIWIWLSLFLMVYGQALVSPRKLV